MCMCACVGVLHASAGTPRHQRVPVTLKQLQAVVPHLAWAWEPNLIEFLASDPSPQPQEVFLTHTFHGGNGRARIYSFMYETASHEHKNADLLQDGSSLLPLEDGSPEIEVNILSSSLAGPVSL